MEERRTVVRRFGWSGDTRTFEVRREKDWGFKNKTHERTGSLTH
jgi:hypothetical protein